MVVVFPRPVRTERTEDLPFPDGKFQFVYGLDLTEPFAEALDLDNLSVFHFLPPLMLKSLSYFFFPLPTQG